MSTKFYKIQNNYGDKGTFGFAAVERQGLAPTASRRKTTSYSTNALVKTEKYVSKDVNAEKENVRTRTLIKLQEITYLPSPLCVLKRKRKHFLHS